MSDILDKKESGVDSKSKLSVADKFSIGKENIMIIAAGVVVVILGFILMSGGGSEDPSEFNKEELFSGRRITLAPFLVILGYVVVIFGIMRKPKS